MHRSTGRLGGLLMVVLAVATSCSDAAVPPLKNRPAPAPSLQVLRAPDGVCRLLDRHTGLQIDLPVWQRRTEEPLLQAIKWFGPERNGQLMAVFVEVYDVATTPASWREQTEANGFELRDVREFRVHGRDAVTWTKIGADGDATHQMERLVFLENRFVAVVGDVPAGCMEEFGDVVARSMASLRIGKQNPEPIPPGCIGVTDARHGYSIRSPQWDQSANRFRWQSSGPGTRDFAPNLLGTYQALDGRDFGAEMEKQTTEIEQSLGGGNKATRAHTHDVDGRQITHLMRLENPKLLPTRGARWTGLHIRAGDHWHSLTATIASDQADAYDDVIDASLRSVVLVHPVPGPLAPPSTEDKADRPANSG